MARGPRLEEVELPVPWSAREDVPPALEQQPALAIEPDPCVRAVDLLLHHEVPAGQRFKRNSSQVLVAGWGRDPWRWGVRGYLYTMRPGMLFHSIRHLFEESMKRTTIFADEATVYELKRIAYQQRRSMSAVVREALATYIAAYRPRGRRFSFTEIGESRTGDASQRVDDLLGKDSGGRPPSPA